MNSNLDPLLNRLQRTMSSNSSQKAPTGTKASDAKAAAPNKPGNAKLTGVGWDRTKSDVWNVEWDGELTFITKSPAKHDAKKTEGKDAKKTNVKK
jgi:hypothetical protein